MVYREKCWKCNGTGRVRVNVERTSAYGNPDGMENLEPRSKVVTCDVCGGKGWQEKG